MAQNSHDFLLTVAPDSPGSSVFDLPTHQVVQQQPSAVTPLSQLKPTSPEPKGPSCVVISGGTGGNAICSAFSPEACYVLPVSDDGGSSSEIIRVLGGPSVGDIRSRLIRLIPSASSSPSPQEAIKALLAHRLPADCTEREAREQWRDIVEGRSILWSGIPSDRKETIRGFLVYFESELLKRAHKNFTFVNGSIGNYFIAAAQQFFRSLPSAIFLIQSITRSQASIIPVLVTNHTVTIAAELKDGKKLVGQCEISHPVISTSPSFKVEFDEDGQDQDADGIGETIRHQSSNVKFESQAKDAYESLPSPISRLLYINAYGMEIHPSPNPDYLSGLATRDVLVYSCGSLWTSIIPCLALRGVGPAIARSRSLKAKILLLNSQNDRETEEYTAADYIHAIARTLNAEYQRPQLGLGRGNAHTNYPISAFVTDLVYLKGTEIHVDVKKITAMGVRCLEIIPESGATINPRFSAEDVRDAIDQVLAIRAE
ncbi:hypothetical protein DL96DRAFT_1564550 [Flagelloscypha sp. PMI_526]|nr:hypothetical protein DL96DRAFT_1564550 [Flagelloscypha sp. PMI_526]